MSYEGYKEGRHKSKGGLIRSFVKLDGNRIQDIEFSGDFFLFPETAIEKIAETLKGVYATSDSVLDAVRLAYDLEGIIAPGTVPEDFVTSIMLAVEA